MQISLLVYFPLIISLIGDCPQQIITIIIHYLEQVLTVLPPTVSTISRRLVSAPLKHWKKGIMADLCPLQQLVPFRTNISFALVMSKETRTNSAGEWSPTEDTCQKAYDHLHKHTQPPLHHSSHSLSCYVTASNRITASHGSLLLPLFLLHLSMSLAIVPSWTTFLSYCLLTGLLHIINKTLSPKENRLP